MPELMIKQDKYIVKYINNLNLPYSSAIQNHMANMISGIILTEGHKTLSAIYNKITCNRNRSNASRFLSEYSWNNEYVDDVRIEMSLSAIRKNIAPKAVGFLIVDDTLSKKDKSTKKIEGLDYHNSHTDGNRPMWSHCIVTSHYHISEYSIPLNYKLYLRKEFLRKKAAKFFRNKQELAMDLIDEFVPVTDVTYLLIDSWYTSAKVMLHALSEGYHTIGRIESNRVIYPGGIKTNLSNFAKLISKFETCPVTVGEETYYIYRYEGKLNDLENAVILFSWNKKGLSDQPVFIISTDIALDNSTIIKYYQNRWNIEVSYRYHKTSLGFDEYQVQSLKSIKRFWSMEFMTYTFLELFRVSNKKKFKFETLGDVIGHFRNKYLVNIVDIAYSRGKNNMDKEEMFSKLGLVA